MRTNRFFLLVLLSIPTIVIAQLRDYRIHQRGMLHQTVFNTGELGRAYDNGVGGVLDGLPSMEWPPNSSILLERTRMPGNITVSGAVCGLPERGPVAGSTCTAVRFPMPTEIMYLWRVSTVIPFQ